MRTRSLVLTLLILATAAVGWLLVYGVQPGRSPAPTPGFAEPHAAPTPAAADVEEAELVAPDAREALEPPAPEEPEAALTDGIVEPPTPPLPDFEARYAGVPPDELEVRRDLLRKKLFDYTQELMQQEMDAGRFESIPIPEGPDTYTHTRDTAYRMRVWRNERGIRVRDIVELDQKTDPRTSAMRAEVDWLDRKVAENHMANK